MKIIKTKFQGLIIFKKKYFKDSRGYFLELYKKKFIKKNFPFTCISYSKKNVIRGMHMQIKNTQAKYISVLKGRVLDVVVDLRKNSRTFGKYFFIKSTSNLESSRKMKLLRSKLSSFDILIIFFEYPDFSTIANESFI